MANFKFNIGDTVSLIESEETGTITGRAEYGKDENSYYVRYCAGDGRQVHVWWPESSLDVSS